LGQKLDRHHSLGQGEIGWHAFEQLMADPRIDEIPMILETADPSIWPQEIQSLMDFAGFSKP
jgi:deoxyribonuclease-4